ncbi:hypothetical protein [Actinoplanes palleronii]|uniref:Uncharacterized protein n=1 Tax=Actinoplanes palleronii TaxID=113570 RepID=A0ABQ4BRP3_9ACTN|nr:hypothetical protein [Actinoplanes palleronii]GIE73327.1 hypothetical protein Apa02nite_094350 [Actinoplanes palleronii]
MTLQVALEALRSDAARWERVAHVTNSASAGAQTLGLSPVQLSWASLETGLSNTYDSLLDKTVRLLDEATDVYRDLGTTALLALVVGLIGAICSSATIVGLPAAPFIASGAALICSASMITGAEILKGVCSSADATLRQKFDNPGFHEGHWPPAVKP